MQLAVEDPGANSSNCGEGYSCTYTNTISWSSPTDPLPMELNPQVVFERMFGDGSTVEQRAKRRKRDGSILDSLTGSLSKLRAESSAADRVRIDNYTENVREIERRLEIAMKASTVAPTDMTVPVGVPQTFDEHIKLQFDLMALAFQADITRVGTLLFARDLTGRTYPESESPTLSFHGVSHHGEDPRRIADLSKINQYHVKMLAHLIEKLDKTPDGDGTLLDHSLVLYGSNMGNSNQHVHYDVPHVLVGGLNGKLKGGRHLAYPPKTVPTGNLLLSMLDMYDIHQDSIGDSTGRLETLLEDATYETDRTASGACSCCCLPWALPRRTPTLPTRPCAATKWPCRSWWSKHADVNAPQGDGATALHWAVFRSDKEMVNLLLRRARIPRPPTATAPHRCGWRASTEMPPSSRR